MADIDLEFFPNTGHFYSFYPFDRNFLLSHGGRRGPLAKLCETNSHPWVEAYLTRQEDGKEVHETCHWIRYRYGKKNQTPGIWIAVETNLGDYKRGTLLLPQREVKASELPPESEWKATPYVARNAAELEAAKDANGGHLVTISVANPESPSEMLHSLELQIIWSQPQGVPVDVDLIVDFGNTRSVVLALENNAQAGARAMDAICHSILFMPRGYEYPASEEEIRKDPLTYCTIEDSWFLLQQPNFSEWIFPKSDRRPEGKLYTGKEVTTTMVPNPDYSLMGGLFGKKGVPREIPVYTLTEYMPHMFVEVSPALMGAEARESFCKIADLGAGYNISLSSPKRYLWDTEKIDSNVRRNGAALQWHMHENSWSKCRRLDTKTKLHGQICMYMYDDGRDWNINNPPYLAEKLTSPVLEPEQPNYPYASAMVWAALSILENAYHQISSYNWRRLFVQGVNRRLRSVNITFPSGWIAREREQYRKAWQQAIDIFTLSRMESTEYMDKLSADKHSPAMCGRPRLYMELDEAVASQLPFVYSEVLRLNGNANLWTRLYGRYRQNRNTGVDPILNYRVRVMTIDIGGGTCDTSIVEYRSMHAGAQTSMCYNVLFRDCNTVAGDAVMKCIIERVLLPAFIKKRKKQDAPEFMTKFIELMASQRATYASKIIWRRIVSQLFLPVVRKWLTDMNTCPNGYYVDPRTNISFRSLARCGADERAIKDFCTVLKQADLHLDESEWEYREDGAVESDGFVRSSDVLEYSPADINDCIRRVLQKAIEPLSKFIASYGVDIVTVSGKITEMEEVQKLLVEYLPICPQRIVRMKNYAAGSWYPSAMAKASRIQDAKSVTAVGAALFVACKPENNILDANWIAKDPNTEDYVPKNYWGLISSDGNRTSLVAENDILLRPQDDDNSDKTFVSAIDNESEFCGNQAKIGSFIGRMKYYSVTAMPEQQYELVWVGEGAAPSGDLAIQIGRVNDAGDDDITLLGVQALSPLDRAKNVSTKTVQLRFNTMPQSGFWMEECVFDMVGLK